MSKTLVVAQHADGSSTPASPKRAPAHRRSAAKSKSSSSRPTAHPVASEAAKLAGVTKVLQLDNAGERARDRAVLAPQIADLAKSRGGIARLRTGLDGPART